MNSVVVKVWLGVLATAIAAYGAYTAIRIGRLTKDSAPPAVIQLTPEPQPMGELQKLPFVESTGANLRWQQLDGHIWVANSFYSTCNAECSQLSTTIRALGQSLPEVRFLSMTCDPDVDTPEKLREYAATFQADPDRWHFVTGEMRDLSRAGEILFGMPLGRKQHGGYVALVDRQGRRVGAYDLLSRQGFLDLVAEIGKLQSASEAPRAPEPA